MSDCVCYVCDLHEGYEAALRANVAQLKVELHRYKLLYEGANITQSVLEAKVGELTAGVRCGGCGTGDPTRVIVTCDVCSQRAVDAWVRAERERCAKVADSFARKWHHEIDQCDAAAETIAEAIRRGE